MPAPIIVYEFSRSSVESVQFQPFLDAFNPAAFNPISLRGLMNTLVLCMSGWDEDPREIYLIPAVRRFYRSLHANWPYSLYFLNLDHDSLRILAFCCLENLIAVSIDGRLEAGVQIDPVELARFLTGSFPAMNLLCEQAGMSENQIFDRTRKVFDYFQLPFLG